MLTSYLKQDNFRICGHLGLHFVQIRKNLSANSKVKFLRQALENYDKNDQ